MTAPKEKYWDRMERVWDRGKTITLIPVISISTQLRKSSLLSRE
jgi:hypothetical protein